MALALATAFVSADHSLQVISVSIVAAISKNIANTFRMNRVAVIVRCILCERRTICQSSSSLPFINQVLRCWFGKNKTEQD